jgi:large subunit ribosomal protein L25
MLSLRARPRDVFGKKLSAVRKTGAIPGILYGKQVGEPIPVFVEKTDFSKVFKEAGESTLINLQIQDKEKKEFPVLIFDVQRNPLSLNLTHIDFYQLPLDEKIKVTVPLVFSGTAPAVALGGTFVRHIQGVTVSAMPLQLPREIEVTISHLGTFEDSVKIRDLTLPEGVEIVGRNGDDIVAQVVEFQEEKVEEELKAPAEGVVGEVKLSEERGKKEEEPAPAEEKTAQQQ